MHESNRTRSLTTILLALLLALLLAGCSGKDVTPEELADEAAAEEAMEAKDGVTDETASSSEASDDVGLDIETLVVDPVGTIRLKDGTTHELTKLKTIGKYYIYIVGKLGGRSSTVISLTRLRDLRRWKTIVFKDPHTFTITSQNDKELVFTDAYLFIGSDSATTYSFISANPMTFEDEDLEVKKLDVVGIEIIPEPQE